MALHASFPPLDDKLRFFEWLKSDWNIFCNAITIPNSRGRISTWIPHVGNESLLFESKRLLFALGISWRWDDLTINSPPSADTSKLFPPAATTSSREQKCSERLFPALNDMSTVTKRNSVISSESRNLHRHCSGHCHLMETPEHALIQLTFLG